MKNTGSAKTRPSASYPNSSILRSGLLFFSLSLTACTFHANSGPFIDLLARDYDSPRKVKLGKSKLDDDRKASQGAKLEKHAAKDEQDSEESKKSDKDKEEVSDYRILLIPLPVVATSPNTGLTVGTLPVFLFQETERLSTILAPRILVNELTGTEATIEARRYFTRDIYFKGKAGASTKGEFDYEIQYRHRNLANKLLELDINFTYTREFTRRFYGFGNRSKENAESSYGYRETSIQAEVSFRLPLLLRLSVTPRLERILIGPGQVDDLPSTGESFPNLPGADQTNELYAQRFGVFFDSRDSSVVPTRGLLLSAEAEFARTVEGPRMSYIRVDTNATVHIDSLDKLLVTVGRVGVSFINGPDAPFYKLPQVGGKETNRGYGAGRFVGERAYLANLEQRFNVWKTVVMENAINLQLAAFLDVGRVWQRGERPRLTGAKTSAGGAVRLIVPDSELVTSIDVGVANEGMAAFVGLDYPF